MVRILSYAILSRNGLTLKQMSDSYNHVFKQSLNSLNRAFISGGSSGGEGALVGCHGSIVGVGTDIGGSIRIPANLQGLYGLNPTTGRFPWHPSVIRDNIVNGVAGPLTSSLNTLELFMKGLLQAEPWKYEPTSHPIPWRDELAQKPTRKLRIGYYVDDGMVKVQPPIERAMHEVVTKLRAAGHDVFEWDVSSHIEGQRLWTKAILADGGRKCARLCEEGNEPLVPGMLVGQDKDRLSVDEANEVSSSSPLRSTLYRQSAITLLTPALIHSSTPSACSIKKPTSAAGFRPTSTL